jgi:hypothetical protein
VAWQQQHQVTGTAVSLSQEKIRPGAGVGVISALARTINAIVTVYRVGNNRNLGDATEFQQQYMTQYANDTARVDINPRKQMMIDLEYFTEELKTDGFEVVVLIDANKPIDHSVRAHSHQHNYKTNNGFHIDGLIYGAITTYIQNCGLINILAKHHAALDAEIPNTHLRGSKQIDFVLATPGIALFIDPIGLLDFDVIFRTDHRTFFIDINIAGIL